MSALKCCGKMLRVSVVLILLIRINCSGVPCSHFEFPTLNNARTVTANENTTISLPFRMVFDSCNLTDCQTLQVTKLGRQEEIIRQFLYGCCTASLQKCIGLDVNKLFQFNHTVSRHDNTQWRWSSSSSSVAAATVTFNISYPSNIVNFTVTQQDGLVSSPVLRDSSVDLICIWEEGNPPVTARLLDKHGVEIKGSNKKGEIRYRFPAVGCQDAGLIRCEAPGASHNKTATLLVQCTPEFGELSAIVSKEDTLLTMPLWTHTDNSSQCKLKKLEPASQVDAEILLAACTTAVITENCFNLTGTPPDLTLTVRLDNVRKEEEGQWRLELTNDAGTGHVDFCIGKTISPCPEGPDEENTRDKFPAQDKSQPRVVYISAGAAAVAVVVSISVGAFVTYRVCERRNQRQVMGHNAQVHQDGFQGNRHVNHAVMMVNRGGAAAVIIQNNVDGGAAHVPDANAYEEIPAHGLLPDPVVHNAPQAAAVNQPAGQEPNVNDVCVPIDDMLARKHQAGQKNP